MRRRLGVPSVLWTAGYSACRDTILWSVDANSALTPESALAYLPVLRELNTAPVSVFMLEQPFPADFLYVVKDDVGLSDPSYNVAAWQQVFKEYDAAGYVDAPRCNVAVCREVHAVVCERECVLCGSGS
jgi:hypothetical protein